MDSIFPDSSGARQLFFREIARQTLSRVSQE
jgi:hypothetical protein